MEYLTQLLLTAVVILPSAFLFFGKRNRSKTRAVGSEEREAERERKTEMERLIKQMEIGDPIFRMLENARVLTGLPVNKNIWRNSNHLGTYRIEVNFVDEQGRLVEKIATIVISLKWPKNQQVFLTCEKAGVFGGSSKSALFSATDGRKNVESKLIPEIFPPKF